MRKKLPVLLGAICLALLLVALPFVGACAQPAPGEPVTLKIVSFLPPFFSTPKAIIETLQAEVAQRSNGELTIDWVGGPEAIPMFEQPPAVADGVVDMAFTVGPFYKDRVPENVTLMLSQITPTEARETGYYDAIREAHEKANMYFLGQSSYMSGYFLWLTDKIETPSDLAGLKFPTDPTRDPFFKALGIIGIDMEDSEVYPGLERGVIDGMADPVAPTWGGNMHEVVNYVINHPYFQTNAVIIINMDTWNRLPDHLQKVLIDSQIVSEKLPRDQLIQQNEDFYQNLLGAGVEPIQFSSADAKWFIDLAYSTAWKDVESMIGSEETARLRKLMVK